MHPDINKLNDAWIGAGQKVEDLNAKLNAAALDDKFSKEDFESLKAQRDNARAQRDALGGQVAEARAAEVAKMDNNAKKPLSEPEKSVEDKFVADFKAMVRGDAKIVNLITSDTDEAGNAIGLTIPQDIETAINLLKRKYDQLEQFVTVEKVGTLSGSRVYEKFSEITPLADLDDETATIADNDDPKLHLIKYLIHRYAGINTITNSLLKDTADNLLAWLSSWIAKKVVVTRNQKIVAAFAGLKNKKTVATFDDVKDLILLGVDTALQASSLIITNKSGFAVLAKVKDAEGRYMVQPDVTQPERKQIEGVTVHVIEDRDLPSAEDGSFPLIYGDTAEAVTLFDRENMSLLTTNVGGGAFEKDQTKIRVIDRFDVQLTDDEAAVYGSFSAIADQTPKA
ncbi:phage major capsid protein [Lacticaseibacillus parakribbianus]|uniref:phage major capsid protein n=1 Tax=Lacticaseibacillus parakribbianus TaxID=2970927 RepID=UPI003B84AF7A